VSPYVDFRLRAAGYRGKDLFQPDAFRLIAFFSNGIPRLVNVICDNALLCAYARSRKIVSADIIKEVARDLRLGAEAQLARAETTPVVAKTEPDTPIRTAASGVPRHKVRRMVKVGFQTGLILLALVAVASLIDPQNFVTNARRSLEVARHNLDQWVLLITHREAVPARINAAVKLDRKPEPKEQRVIIPPGSSIYQIAADAYGANNGLGMDLIQEFNPEIKNLNRVVAGKDLFLPSLTAETLLRKRPDGSYSLIVASFHSVTEANEHAGRLSNKGYTVTITPRRVSHDLLLHRVEIDGLKNLEQANETWLTGLKNEWLAFAGNPDGTR
jgi:hypothetical protein